MSWQYTDPGLAPRAHHVEDLRSEADEYRLTRDLILRRRQQRWASIRAWMTRVLLPAAWRRRREAHGFGPDETCPVIEPS
jgi:hypothetical protein